MAALECIQVACFFSVFELPLNSGVLAFLKASFLSALGLIDLILYCPQG